MQAHRIRRFPFEVLPYWLFVQGYGLAFNILIFHLGCSLFHHVGAKPFPLEFLEHLCNEIG